MDWMIIGAAFIAGWAMLSVFSSERMSRSQQIQLALAKAATEQARQSTEVPIALSNEAALVGSPAAFNRKR
jgi:hypothetical protein